MDQTIFLNKIFIEINMISKIISQKLAKEMLSSHVSKHYGLGVFMREMHGEVNYFGHMGDNRGFFAGFVSHLTDGYGAVVLTNSQNGAQLPGISSHRY